MIICFDIGGTAIKGAFAPARNTIQPLPRIPTPTRDFDGFVAALRSIIDQAETKPQIVSLSICGIIDPDTRRAVIANIPCLDGRRLEDDLQQALQLPVIVANDADCFVLAEADRGAGRNHRIVFGLILGTGVGGGLVIDGQLINRDGGFAGEWGHAPVAATLAGPNETRLPRFPCGCGHKGCLDATCSARGLERIHDHMHGLSLSSEQIVDAWEAGDPKAGETIDVYLDIVSAPLALLVNVTGATIMPVGGGLSRARKLIDAIDLAVRQRCLRRFHHPLVVPAECQIEPGLVGAAALGFARLEIVPRTT